MMRVTGFIVFAAAVLIALVFVVIASFNRMPEPYASCVDQHRERPDIALGQIYDIDLVLDEDRSSVEDGEHDGIGYRIVTARVDPASRAAGRGETLTCYEVDGHGSIVLDEETFRNMVGLDD
ncbi:hypothetical protein [Aquisalimonas sp.]|uniref:hypothetical protein n=1 Tax=unclassified Aquisalimonas TaxID=2644645 RepID=UPI0025C52D3D|nr:hypothetical protein [Aquisalimonas sp.]